MLDAAVVLVVGLTFLGVSLLAPLRVVDEGVVLRAEEATKRLRKHKIKQLFIMKCTVQVMGMATSCVFMAIIILTLALFFHVEHSLKTKSVMRSASAHSNKFENQQ